VAKEKKVEVRDLAYDELASAIIQNRPNLTEIRRHKEGLELNVNGEIVVIRVVKKKADLDESEFRGKYFYDEKEQAFGFQDFKEKTG